MRLRSLLPLLAILMSGLRPGQTLAAEFKFASVISDHAVLQRDVEAPVWGFADTGAVVRVSPSMSVLVSSLQSSSMEESVVRLPRGLQTGELAVPVFRHSSSISRAMVWPAGVLKVGSLGMVDYPFR